MMIIDANVKAKLSTVGQLLRIAGKCRR